jgi:hypothetical protein
MISPGRLIGSLVGKVTHVTELCAGQYEFEETVNQEEE